MRLLPLTPNGERHANNDMMALRHICARNGDSSAGVGVGAGSNRTGHTLRPKIRHVRWPRSGMRACTENAIGIRLSCCSEKGLSRICGEGDVKRLRSAANRASLADGVSRRRRVTRRAAQRWQIVLVVVEQDGSLILGPVRIVIAPAERSGHRRRRHVRKQGAPHATSGVRASTAALTKT